jgi:hypothetical protein
LEVNGIGKHSSLLQYVKSYDSKKFYSTGPWVVVSWQESTFPQTDRQTWGYLGRTLVADLLLAEFTFEASVEETWGQLVQNFFIVPL